MQVQDQITSRKRELSHVEWLSVFTRFVILDLRRSPSHAAWKSLGAQVLQADFFLNRPHKFGRHFDKFDADSHAFQAVPDFTARLD